MSLEVAIEKQWPGIRVAVEFCTRDSPLGLLGPSGSGKSMTLRAIAGLETPDCGRIVLDGRVLFDSERRINLPPRARRIGLLFQNYALFPHLTVAQNIAFGLRRLRADERARCIERQIVAAHLDGLADRFPGSLSGGQQQRAALARALAIDPAALLLDEPFSALDTHLRAALERQLREMLEGYRGATLFVSHNIEEAYRVCGDLVILSRGTVAARGPKEEIFRHPPTLEVARLTGCKNFSRARRLDDGRIEALDWGGCVLRVAHSIAALPRHIAIRAHHLRIRAVASQAKENEFPCRLAAITETPFRVTLDLKLDPKLDLEPDLRASNPPSTPADFHLQAEIFKQEWESFRELPQPWHVELAPDRLFLLPD